MRAYLTTLIAVAALAACGGEEAAAPEEPRLPRAVAERLAQRSEAVATALAEGDACRADERAAALRDEARRAVEAEEVPPELRAELERTARELEAQIECAPAPAADEDEQDEDRDRDEKKKEKKEKKKEKDKEDKDKGEEDDGVLDDALEDVPAPTEDGLTTTQEEPPATTTGSGG